MLCVKDELWKSISRGNINSIICPDCMERIHKGKFNYTELKRSDNNYYLPANIYYGLKNFLGESIFMDDLRNLINNSEGLLLEYVLQDLIWSCKNLDLDWKMLINRVYNT